MSEILPIFPLELVTFPYEKLRLHIFEPKYKQMIQECDADGTTFGIVSFINGKLMNVGTEMKLNKVFRVYEDGKLDIEVEGTGIFEVSKIYKPYSGKLYIAAETSPIPFDNDLNENLSAILLDLANKIFNRLKVNAGTYSPATFRSYDLAHHIGFTLLDEYKVLTTTSEDDRLQLMIMHLKEILPTVKEEEMMRNRANLNGHFQHLTPPDF